MQIVKRQEKYEINYIDYIILVAIQRMGIWWRRDKDTSASEAHYLGIKYSGFHKYYLETVCNCDSHSASEGKIVEKIFRNYWDIRKAVKEFVNKFDHLRYILGD